ncbi:PQQ-dependent sugar dehydrogenase [Flexithrix dorotheae]|uniref:PQQ-dependent sugar dehydrogenase n=1 Tax=Flexithrix dorotheae TaxID=70993 RepID=UPI0003683DC4|nr:PQQ-dependent sugar dehydrogenase [Flexithrix dorotheae]
MGESVKPIVFLIKTGIAFCFLLGCNSPKTQRGAAVEIALSKYQAHLQLEKTTLLVSEVIGDREVVWDLAWGPDNWIWFTEQKGLISKVNPETGEVKTIHQIDDLIFQKSRGLYCLAFHPDFEHQPFVFLHYTYASDTDEKPGKSTPSFSKIVRFEYDKEKNQLHNPKIILGNIPGKSYHNGSRMVISEDHKLFLTTGDAGNKRGSQDVNLLSGKVLRMNLDGSVPEDNPIPGSLVYSWGHRNSQGIVFGKNGILYSSEHGPNNDDEVNIIQPLGNYGWPNVEGFCDKAQEKQFCLDSGVIEPLIAYTPTIAVAGLSIYENEKIPEWNNSLLLGSLKGRSLRVLKLNPEGSRIEKEGIFFQLELGRIRDVMVSPDGDIYLCTSNLDWHPKSQPWTYDHLPLKGFDKIIRLSKADENLMAKISQMSNQKLLTENEEQIEIEVDNYVNTGLSLYQRNCMPCHQENGNGVPDLIPPLSETEWVTGDKDKLIATVLNGLSDEIEVNGKLYNQEMPGFATSLNDGEIAEILTFIRSNFGNNASEISRLEVNLIREKTVL